MSKAKYMKISEFCDTGSGTTPSRQKSELYYGGSIPWIKSGELRESLITECEEKVTELALKETSLKIVPSGALLVAMYGATVGRIGRLGIEATTNQAVCHILPNPKIADNQYMFYALQNKTSEFVSKGVGGAQPNISQGTIKDTSIYLPPLEEQKRIAAILDQADALRRQRQRALNRLNQLGQSIFYEMFGDWRNEPNASLTKLGDHLDFLTSGSRGWAEYYSDEGSLFLRIQNVKNDKLDLTDIAFVNAPETAESKRTRVKTGDVLLSITADLGRTAVIPANFPDAYINQHLAILRTSYFNPRFLSAAFSSPAGQSTVLKRNRAGVKAGLNFDDIKSFELPDVERGKQEEFDKRMQAVDAQIELQQRELIKLNSLFSCLQHRAFRGELGTGLKSGIKGAAA